MTDLDLKALRESAEEPYSYDGHEDTILALIDRVEAAERERDRLREAAQRLVNDNWVEEPEPTDHSDYSEPAGPAYLGDGQALEALRAALAPQSPEGEKDGGQL